jgi:hypothetical protein
VVLYHREVPPLFMSGIAGQDLFKHCRIQSGMNELSCGVAPELHDQVHVGDRDEGRGVADKGQGRCMDFRV